MVFVREEPRSQVVLTPEEQAAQMAADGKSPQEIEAALAAQAFEAMRRQTEYDKAPPPNFVKVPD